MLTSSLTALSRQQLKLAKTSSNGAAHPLSTAGTITSCGRP